MSKHKKPQQKNLSLKERLAKHWDNGNWDLFAALFSRDREASMRTPLADRWHDALYNSLTKALFADKSLANAEATIALIDVERGAFGVPALLGDCSDVASDFLKAHKNAFLKELSPLKAEANLPAPYASLRKGLASFVSSSAKERKSQKDSAAALAEKYAAQYARLGRAKTLAPYTTWLKIAEQLEHLSKGTEHEPIFRAIRAITALIRELFRTGRGENSLRKTSALLGSKLFLAVPQGQSHPAVKALWSFFCDAGEQKYGSDWGEAARVAQVSFMADESLRQIKTQYNRLMQSDRRQIDLVISNLIRSSSAWTEQELYILYTVFTDEFDIDSAPDFSIGTQFLESFGVLARIGRRWRPEAPWPDSVQKNFSDFLHSLPAELIPSLLSQVPYDAMSPYNMVILSLIDARHFRLIEKNMQGRLPFRFDEAALREIGEHLAADTPPRWTVQVLDSLMGQTGRDAALTHLIRLMIDERAKCIIANKRLMWPSWAEFSRGGILEETAALLPQDNLMGCFCRLCSGMKPCHISSEPTKTEAFFEALSLTTDDSADTLLVLLLTWQNVAPEFLIRLFENSFMFRGKKNTAVFDTYLLSVAVLLEKIPNEKNRGAASSGILKLIRQIRKGKGSGAFNKAVKKLTLLANGEGLGGTSFLDKVKKNVRKLTGQGVLPFGED